MVLLISAAAVVAVVAFALGFFSAILLAAARASRRIDLPPPDASRNGRIQPTAISVNYSERIRLTVSADGAADSEPGHFRGLTPLLCNTSRNPPHLVAGH